MDKTVCELFAGVGGFRLGLEKSSKSWKTVWFSQWEPGRKIQWAHDCYVKHWKDVNEYTGCDIVAVSKEEIPDHNLLVGGFPCQDYSVARSLSGEKGIEGKKGVLWWEIFKILQVKKPPFVLLENVDRLLKSPSAQRGRDFGVMLACFAKCGYRVEWRIINAADYGAAQRRRRVFIFAYHINTKYAERVEKIKTIDLLNKQGFFAKTFPIELSGVKSEIEFEYEDLAEISDNFNFQFENAGHMVDGKIITGKVDALKEIPQSLSDIMEKQVEQKYYIGSNLDKWEYLKGGKNEPRVSKTGYEYRFTEGPIAFPDPIDKPARTILTSESSVNRSTHVVKDEETGKLRLLTPVEAERIQGFDDNWTNTGMPEKFRYFCMGNALVVSMVTRMAKTLEKIFKAED